MTEAYLADPQPSHRRRIKGALVNIPGKTPGEKLEHEISLKHMYHAPKQNSLIYFALHQRYRNRAPSYSTFLKKIYPELNLPSAKAIKNPALRKAESEHRKDLAIQAIDNQYFSQYILPSHIELS